MPRRNERNTTSATFGFTTTPDNCGFAFGATQPTNSNVFAGPSFGSTHTNQNYPPITAPNMDNYEEFVKLAKGSCTTKMHNGCTKPPYLCSVYIRKPEVKETVDTPSGEQLLIKYTLLHSEAEAVLETIDEVTRARVEPMINQLKTLNGLNIVLLCTVIGHLGMSFLHYFSILKWDVAYILKLFGKTMAIDGAKYVYDIISCEEKYERRREMLMNRLRKILARGDKLDEQLMKPFPHPIDVELIPQDVLLKCQFKDKTSIQQYVCYILFRSNVQKLPNLYTDVTFANNVTKFCLTDYPVLWFKRQQLLARLKHSKMEDTAYHHTTNALALTMYAIPHFCNLKWGIYPYSTGLFYITYLSTIKRNGLKAYQRVLARNHTTLQTLRKVYDENIDLDNTIYDS